MNIHLILKILLNQSFFLAQNLLERSVTAEKEVLMNLMVNQLASVNLFVIWLVVLGAFVFLKVIKNHLEE